MQTSLHARKSKTVLDSGIHPLYPGFKVMDSAFQSIVRLRIPWFVFRIPDSRIHKQTFPRFRNPDSFEVSPHVSESETVLDSGFLAVYSRFQILDSIFFVSGIGIPDYNRYSDSVFRIPKPRIPDSTNQIFLIPDCTSKICPDSQIRIRLHGAKDRF